MAAEWSLAKGIEGWRLGNPGGDIATWYVSYDPADHRSDYTITNEDNMVTVTISKDNPETAPAANISIPRCPHAPDFFSAMREIFVLMPADLSGDLYEKIAKAWKRDLERLGRDFHIAVGKAHERAGKERR